MRRWSAQRCPLQLAPQWGLSGRFFTAGLRLMAPPAAFLKRQLSRRRCHVCRQTCPWRWLPQQSQLLGHCCCVRRIIPGFFLSFRLQLLLEEFRFFRLLLLMRLLLQLLLRLLLHLLRLLLCLLLHLLHLLRLLCLLLRLLPHRWRQRRQRV